VLDVRTPSDGRQRAVLVAVPADRQLPSVRLWATLPRYPAIVPGDRIEFSAQPEAPPDTGPFGDYLRRSGIGGTVLVRDMQLGATGRSPVEGIRRASGDAIAAVLPEPQAGLAAGIVIGLRDRVDRSVADDFATAGLSHVVAISGWNIAMVAGCLAAVLRGLGRRPRSVVTVTAICAYTLFAGASPSVVRAALMAGVVVVARESGRRGAAATALGLAAWLMLVADPATVSDAGFQLSVAATGGLLAWGTPLAGAIGRRAGGMPRWLSETLGVSLAAQFATLPIVLLAFGRLSLVAPIANLLVAPLVAPAMLMGVVALVAGVLVSAGVPALLAIPITTAGWAVFGGLLASGHVAAAVPFASLELPEPWNAIGAVAAAVPLAVAGVPSLRRAARRASRLGRR
jgi:competence protein ComEC